MTNEVLVNYHFSLRLTYWRWRYWAEEDIETEPLSPVENSYDPVGLDF
jgi:hypothetical protein